MLRLKNTLLGPIILFLTIVQLGTAQESDSIETGADPLTSTPDMTAPNQNQSVSEIIKSIDPSIIKALKPPPNTLTDSIDTPANNDQSSSSTGSKNERQKTTTHDTGEQQESPQDKLLRMKKKEEYKLSSIEAMMNASISTDMSISIYQFGYSIFNKSISSFSPVSDVPVGPDYIVGPGDSLVIDVWGKINWRRDETIDRTGSIFLPNIGAINVWGLSVENMRVKIQREIAKHYSGFDLAITLGSLRTISVYMMGAVNNPGVFHLSSLASMFNALFETGGPSHDGTLRDILLKRNGKTIAHLDVYDFLLAGDKINDQKLLSGDTIFVPPRKTTIGIVGQVERPAIYELVEPKVSLRDVINLAGGIKKTGYLGSIQIIRTKKHQYQTILDVKYNEAELIKALKSPNNLMKDIGEKLDYELEHGDIVKIFSIIPGKKGIITLSGHFIRPGEYEYKSGMTLKDVIPSLTSLLPSPFLPYAAITRTLQPSWQTKIIPFSVQKLLDDDDPSSDIPLEERDDILVYANAAMTPKWTVEIKGPVKTPGTHPFIDGITVRDLIYKSGNLTPDAYLEYALIVRKSAPEQSQTILVPIRLRDLFTDDKANVELIPQDVVILFTRSNFEQYWPVYIHGLVANPGQYVYRQNLRIRDLVFLAGNIQRNAFLEKAELIRWEQKSVGVEQTRIYFNLGEALKENPEHNLQLNPYDRLYIRRIPDWYEEMIVTIDGEVVFPGSYSFSLGERLHDVLLRTGGYSKYAYLPAAIFTRTAVKAMQQERLSEYILREQEAMAREQSKLSELVLEKSDIAIAQQTLQAKEAILRRMLEARVTGRIVIQLQPIETFKETSHNLFLNNGDNLVVPTKPDFVAVTGEVYNPNAVIFEQEENVAFYLEKVGGISDEADDGNLFIIRADGTVISQRNNDGIIFGRFYGKELLPGDTIFVPKDFSFLNILGIVRDVSTILFQLATTAGVVMTVTGIPAR